MINPNPRKFKIQLRKTVRGMNLRPEILRLDGKLVTLISCGFQDEDDKYPGEEMLWPEVGTDSSYLFDESSIAWIASGDVIELM